MFCAKRFSYNDRFCPHCGYDTNSDERTSSNLEEHFKRDCPLVATCSVCRCTYIMSETKDLVCIYNGYPCIATVCGNCLEKAKDDFR